MYSGKDNFLRVPGVCFTRKDDVMKTQIQDMTRDILRVVGIKSVVGEEAGIRRCQELVMDMARDMGFDTYFAGEEKVVIVQPKNLVTPAKIGIVVHLDTVPLNSNDWMFDPLGEVCDGRIYGRGVIDDKAPIVMALHAFKELEGVIEDSWQIIIGSDEEGDWNDMTAFLTEKPELPKFLVTIDGDGVQNGCRGYMDVELTFKRNGDVKVIKDFFINGEASNNTLPARTVIYQYDGRNYLGTGVEVHSSNPRRGHSAITDIANRIREDAYREYPGMFELLRTLDKTYDSKVIGFDGADVSVTNVQKHEDAIILNLNLRFEEEPTHGQLAAMKEIFNEKYDAGVYFRNFFKPSKVETNSFEIQAMVEAYKFVIGKEPRVTIAKGLGYNAALPNCAIFGPRFQPDHDEPDLCHKTDESRSIYDIMMFYEMLLTFLMKVL